MKMLAIKTLALFALALPAHAESLRIACVDQESQIELQSRDLTSYQLKENGKTMRGLNPTYQDEEMVQLELNQRVYQFTNLAGCIDANGAKVKSLLVLSERLEQLRPFAALPCSCVYR